MKMIKIANEAAFRGGLVGGIGGSAAGGILGGAGGALAGGALNTARYALKNRKIKKKEDKHSLLKALGRGTLTGGAVGTGLGALTGGAGGAGFGSGFGFGFEDGQDYERASNRLRYGKDWEKRL